MSQKIDPRVVLAYLNEIGYTNINAQQLKEFIRDLKKLIKYDIRKSTYDEDDKENYTATKTQESRSNFTSNLGKTSGTTRDTTDFSEQQRPDIFSSLHSQHTVASKAKETEKQEKHISLHIRKSKQNRPDHIHCIHVEDVQRNTTTSSDTAKTTQTTTESGTSKVLADTEVTLNSTSKPESRQSKSSTKVSFASQKMIQKPSKCDPVTLYHKYREEWQKQKFPGEENHSHVRWAVKRKLLNCPPISCPSYIGLGNGKRSSANRI